MSAAEKQPLRPVTAEAERHAAASGALAFMVTVAVSRTILSKTILSDGGGPVGFSAFTCVCTILCLLPVFALHRESWGMLRREHAPGMALAGSLVCIDIAMTNMAVSMLDLPLQQTIGATAPAWTVLIESLHMRRMQHPFVYTVVAALCAGPMLIAFDPFQERKDPRHANTKLIGCLLMLLAVVTAACKYVFTKSIIETTKKELGSFAFLFWIDVFIVCVLVPWSLVNGELVALFRYPKNGGMWVVLVLTATLGGVRALSQFVVLRLVSATSLAAANLATQSLTISLSIFLFGLKVTAFLVCGILLTLIASATYTYLKVSQLLEKPPYSEQTASCMDRLGGGGGGRGEAGSCGGGVKRPGAEP